MNKRVKKLLSAFISAVMLFTVMLPAFAKEESLPIVYVLGKIDVIKADKDDPNSKTIYPVSLENIDGIAAIKNLSVPLGIALVEELKEELGFDYDAERMDEAWSDYARALYNEIAGLFSEIALGEDGEPKDNSGILSNWRTYPLEDKRNSDGSYDLYAYEFHYDWRLDMFHNAEILSDYINEVLQVTGKKKCILVSRCYGCNLVSAYLKEYGCDKIDTNIFYCSTALGAVVCGEMFCGKMKLNAEGMDRYLDDLLGVNPILAILGAGLRQSNFSGSVSSVFNMVYKKISETMMPDTLRNTFASMPGYWSLVGEEYYEEAKDYVFAKNSNSFFIDKIDAYHYGVMDDIEDIIVEAVNGGMKYANITKYGNQIAPIIENSDYIGDGIVEVPSASFGAKSVRTNEQFTSDYLNEAVRKGTIRYVSPDYKIDASTCLYPDYTWFTEGVEHFDFPESVDKLIMAIANFGGQMTVDSDKNFPQYMRYSSSGNLLTWAGGLYFENSSDSIVALLRVIYSYFELVFASIRAIFRII